MLRLRQFLTLTRLTAVETARQPVCLLLATLAIVLMALVSLVLMHTFDSNGELARDSALAFHFMFGLLISGYAACSALSREMRSGTAAAVLSKPVGRAVLFLAKFAGVACVVLLFSACASLATLLSQRIAEKLYETGPVLGMHRDTLTGTLLLLAPALAYFGAGVLNYRTRRAFTSAAFVLLLAALTLVFLVSGCFTVKGTWHPYALQVTWTTLSGSLLITMALLVLAAMALTLSTLLQTAPTMAICFAVFLIGLLSDYVLGRHVGVVPGMGILYGLVPNWQHFWLMDALRGNGSIPCRYLVNALLYAAAYAGAVLSVGVIIFEKAEIE